MTQHMADIAHDEIDAARRARAKAGLGPTMSTEASEDVGNIIICDDYSQNAMPPTPPQQPSRAWPMAAGIVLAGALIGGMVSLPAWLDRMKAPAPATGQGDPVAARPVAPSPAPGNTTTIKKGFIIDLPGAAK